MAFMTHIAQTSFVQIDEVEGRQVFNQYLEYLKQGRWVRDGRLMEEHVTSHRYDAVCDDQSDRDLVATIQRLQELLKDRK